MEAGSSIPGLGSKSVKKKKQNMANTRYSQDGKQPTPLIETKG